VIASKIFAIKIQTPENDSEKSPEHLRALVGTILPKWLRTIAHLRGYAELANHAFLGALATLATHLLPTTLILFEAGGTIAAAAQLLYQPPLFTETTRSSAAGLMTCHRRHPLSLEVFQLEPCRYDDLMVRSPSRTMTTLARRCSEKNTKP
jgi:hypothetical protein